MYKNKFISILYQWHQTIDRKLPWKKDPNPYHIWLSEIILQQTRMEQGLPYYLKFTEHYKSIFELAAASEDEVLKLWEGLGYYSRARNLHATARYVAESGGHFPDTYEGLLQLKGVGPYTAAAIGSFAFGIPKAVLDGNVIRFISRYFGIQGPVDKAPVKKILESKLYSVFDEGKPGEFNQAMMDFGSLVCKPNNPECNACPFNESCVAFQKKLIDIIPLKSNKIKKKLRDLNYFILECENAFVIRKRTGNDIWKHLYEFVLVEGVSIPENVIELKEFVANEFSFIEAGSIKNIYQTKHLLTHQKLNVQFHHIYCKSIHFRNGTPYFLVDKKNLDNFAFPKIIDLEIINKSISLIK